MRRPEMRTRFGCLGAVWLLAFLLVGDATAQTAPAPNLKEWFQQRDKNGDGKIDREEFYLGIIEIFYFRDKDKNGSLTIEELQGVVSPEVVRAASRKGDNRLTLDEYVNALFKDFAAADTDGDGTLSFEEIDVYVRTNRR